jgi:hypothetical protein
MIDRRNNLPSRSRPARLIREVHLFNSILILSRIRSTCNRSSDIYHAVWRGQWKIRFVWAWQAGLRLGAGGGGLLSANQPISSHSPSMCSSCLPLYPSLITHHSPVTSPTTQNKVSISMTAASQPPEFWLALFEGDNVIMSP